MPTLERGGLTFRYHDEGAGLPFVFLHGLGGDLSQPVGLCLLPPQGLRLISMDARGHGGTVPVGDPAMFGFGVMAGDVLGLLDALGIERAVVGGISMGAGIALRMAVERPERVLGLVLVRPAWLDAGEPAHLRPLQQIARLLREQGVEAGRRTFMVSAEYMAIRSETAAGAQSLLDQFAEPRAIEAVERLERIPRDVPCPDRNLWRRLQQPALVLGNARDPIHPMQVAQELARELPCSEYREVTSKAVHPIAHALDVRERILDWWSRHFGDLIGTE
jgi:pimeloyl-ACP methyl ester carboxylesterase